MLLAVTALGHVAAQTPSGVVPPAAVIGLVNDASSWAGDAIDRGVRGVAEEARAELVRCEPDGLADCLATMLGRPLAGVVRYAAGW